MNQFTRLTLALAVAVMLLPACADDSPDYSAELADFDSRLDTIEAKLNSAPETVPDEVSTGVPFYDPTDTMPDPKIIVPGSLVNGSRYVGCPIAVTQYGCHANWVDYGLSPTLALSILDTSNGTTLCTVDRFAGRYTEYSVMSDLTYSGSIPVLDVQINAPGAAETQSILAALLGLTTTTGLAEPASERTTLSFPGMCNIYLGNATASPSPSEEYSDEANTEGEGDTYGDEACTGCDGGTSD